MVAVVAGALLALGAVACNGDGGSTTVEVTLQEWAVAANPTSVDAGEVTFEAENIGPDDPHELVVFRTDLAPDSLPTSEGGAVDEAGAGVELIGEIEEFPVGETRSVTFDLEAGSYVLICNIYDANEAEAHYQEGMRLAFTVE